jgi:hypothetical protein
MSTAFIQPVAAAVILCALSYAEDSPLKAYLGLSEAQIQQISRVLRAESRQQFGAASLKGSAGRVYQGGYRPASPPQAEVSAAVLVLTDAQKARLPALEQALQLEMARAGAISLRLIEARQEITSCWCSVEEAFVKRLALTDAQRGELRGRAPVDRLSILTPEQVTKFEALRTRSPLIEGADEAARLRLISDPRPRGECLCN